MENYKVINQDDRQIVQDLDTEALYIPVSTYAKMAETTDLNVEKKAAAGLSYDGILHNPDGWDGIDGVYLIPVSFVFPWLMIDNPNKALIIGTEAVISSIAFEFADAVELEKELENDNSEPE